MKNLFSVKLKQKIKQGLFEYCDAFYELNNRYPTIGEIHEQFYIPNVLQLDESEEITEAVLSRTASFLYEAGVEVEVPTARRAERSAARRMRRLKAERDTEGTPVEIAPTTITPEMRAAFKDAKSPEELGIDPLQFARAMSPEELKDYSNRRQKAIDSGAPHTEFDVGMKLKTPSTPDQTPADTTSKEHEVPNAIWATDRLQKIRTGEVKDLGIADKALVAIDNVISWATGAGQPEAGPIAPPAPKEPVTPPGRDPSVPPEIPTEIPTEIQTEIPTQYPTVIPDKPDEDEKVIPTVIPDTEDPKVDPTEEEEEKAIPARIPEYKPRETTEPEEKTRTTPPKPQDVVTPSRVTAPTTRTTSSKTKPAAGKKEKVKSTPDPEGKLGPKDRPTKEEEPSPKRVGGVAPAGENKPTKTKEEKSKGGSPAQEMPSGVPDERYGALIARMGGIQALNEDVYDPKKSLAKKEKKQKFKVVIIREGGKKVEIFASSVRGVKRAVYGKDNFKVYNQSGSEMTSYFKKPQPKKGN
jgi:hypothetical protein